MNWLHRHLNWTSAVGWVPAGIPQTIIYDRLIAPELRQYSDGFDGGAVWTITSYPLLLLFAAWIIHRQG